MADDDNVTDNMTIWNQEGDKAVTVTTRDSKEALDVNLAGNDSTPNKGMIVNTHLRNGSNVDMDVNGSSTPKVYTAGPPTGKIWYINRMILSITDTNINWQKFGGIAALTNGVDVDYDTAGVNIDLLDGEPIKINSDWVQFCYDTEVNEGPGTLDVVRVRWTFGKSGTVLQLNNADSDLFRVTINDNLNALTEYHTMIQGYEVDE